MYEIWDIFLRQNSAKMGTSFRSDYNYSMCPLESCFTILNSDKQLWKWIQTETCEVQVRID